MRRRLLVLTTTVTVALLLLLLVPLVTAQAEGRAVDLHERRLAAATRFAELPGTVGAADHSASLSSDLRRFAEVTTTTRGWIVGTQGEVLATDGAAPPDDVSGLGDTVRDALAGTPTSAPSALWPWDDDPMLVATPIGRDAQVLGAVVMVEDTGPERQDVAVAMLALGGAAALFVVIVAWLVGVPLVGWVVRPVEQLERRVRDLGRGHRGTAARVEGPPELRSLVHSFNEMATSVEHSRRQQQELVADVSHQLANPLTALRLRLQMLADDEPGVVPVLAETERMARALEAVIEISRAGSFDRAAAPVDVAAQVRERLELWQPLLGDLLTARLLPGPLGCVLEADLVATIVDALLDNCLKYAPDAAVDVDLTATAAEVRLVVRDHGEGLDAVEARDVVGRFARLDRHADVEGTGLGLSILDLRVRDARGTFSVAPADPGTRVEISLPRRAPAGGSSAAPPGAAPAAG